MNQGSGEKKDKINNYRSIKFIQIQKGITRDKKDSGRMIVTYKITRDKRNIK